MGLVDRFQSAWNAFMNKDPTYTRYKDIGIGSAYRPDRPRFTRGNEKTIVTSVYNRLAMDVAAVTFEHVRLDENGRFISVINSGLNNCLTVEANKDQTGRAFIQDVAMSMFDEGVVAIVPIDTTTDPFVTGSFDIRSMRTAQIVNWYPDHVRVKVYNDRIGQKQEITVPKASVCIIENPLYAVMNEPNSTLQRLIRKLALLDVIDEQSGSGKLDLIIQLPYLIKSPARKQQAEERRKDIEMQLAGSRYGVAYTDGTEHITQLNRPLENKLMSQIEYLTSMLYSQLGITTTVMDGTADEQTMLNYHNRSVEPITTAIVDEMKRKFLTKTARSQNQSIYYFRDPFRLVPVSQLAEIADTFTRNEIMSSNEFRQIIGLKPSDNPRADELVNKNMPIEDLGIQNGGMPEVGEGDYLNMVGELDDVDAQLDKLENSLAQRDSDPNTISHAQYASPYYDPVKAHEYYMRTRELKGRKKGQLNEEGRAALSYAERHINEERDAAIKSHRNQTDTKIKDSKNRMISAIKTSRDQTNASVNANTKATNSSVQTNTDLMNKEIDSERKNMKNTIASHKSAMDSQIRQLQDQLANMGPRQKKARREEFAEKIAKLRDENTAKREELQDAFSEFSGTKRVEIRDKNDSLREDNREKNTQLREKHSEKSAEEREKHSEEKTELNEEHSEEKTRLKEEAEKAIAEELEKILQDDRFIKQTGGSSKGSGSRGSGSKKSKDKNTGSTRKKRAPNTYTKGVSAQRQRAIDRLKAATK